MAVPASKPTWTPAAALAARAADLRRRLTAGKLLADEGARNHSGEAGRLFRELSATLDALPTESVLRPHRHESVPLPPDLEKRAKAVVMARAADSDLWAAARREGRWSLLDFATDVVALAPPHLTATTLPQHVELAAWDTGHGHPARLWSLLHADGWEMGRFVKEVVALTR